MTTHKKRLLGTISSIKDNIISCTSPKYDHSFIGEGVLIGEVGRGLIFEINNTVLKILLLISNNQIRIGQDIYTLGETVLIEVSMNILGKIISPFNQVYFENKTKDVLLDTFFESEYKFLDYLSPSIIDRKKVSKPLLTGINSIDCLFPIGLGQRQLIIGDNNTGKTSLATSIILNQQRYNNYSKKKYQNYSKITYFKPCIYVLIGQKRSEAIRIRQVLLNSNSL